MVRIAAHASVHTAASTREVGPVPGLVDNSHPIPSVPHTREDVALRTSILQSLDVARNGILSTYWPSTVQIDD